MIVIFLQSLFFITFIVNVEDILIYIIHPNITSTVDFHNNYNTLIIPLTEHVQIIIIRDIKKKTLSKQKKNFTKRVR